MSIEVKCDKCNRSVNIDKVGTFRWQEEHNAGYRQHALFTLLGKSRNYVLCKYCEELFIQWLKGEPLPNTPPST